MRHINAVVIHSYNIRIIEAESALVLLQVRVQQNYLKNSFCLEMPRFRSERSWWGPEPEPEPEPLSKTYAWTWTWARTEPQRSGPEPQRSGPLRFRSGLRFRSRHRFCLEVQVQVQVLTRSEPLGISTNDYNVNALIYWYIFTDLVALPVFVSGAMENWGIITFRETYLLYSSDESSITEKKRVAAVVGHELSHMVYQVIYLYLLCYIYWLYSLFKCIHQILTTIIIYIFQ